MATPLPQNITGVGSYGTYLNTVTSNLFWPLILLAFFAVGFLTLNQKFGSKRAFASTTFAVAMLGILMRTMEWIHDDILFVTIVGAGIGMLWLVLDKS